MRDMNVIIEECSVSLSVSANDFDPQELLDKLDNLLGEFRTDEILGALAEYEWALDELRKAKKSEPKKD